MGRHASALVAAALVVLAGVFFLFFLAVSSIADRGADRAEMMARMHGAVQFAAQVVGTLIALGSAGGLLAEAYQGRQPAKLLAWGMGLAGGVLIAATTWGAALAVGLLGVALAGLAIWGRPTEPDTETPPPAEKYPRRTE